MLLCGIDVGTSSIKVSIVDAAKQTVLFSCSYPETENEIYSPQPGFAEQDPAHWWFCTQQAILKGNASGAYNPLDIHGIGISYQMHGLVVLDENLKVLRPSIIWCDSRAGSLGEKAALALGETYCQTHLLNSPGNFTAAKLAWVKENQPDIFEKIKHVVLPGDYIGAQLTGNLTCTPSSLSEGIFWDFKQNRISTELLSYFGFSSDLFPTIQPVFSDHGQILPEMAKSLGFNEYVKVTYKAGDQPNNALSLGVLEPGEIATTAGTSGVVYGVSDELKFDQGNRVNSFAHVNYQESLRRIGVLMCINGTGIMNRWLKQNFFPNSSYQQMNELASQAEIGSKGLIVMPFGNGAERIFQNRVIGASFQQLDLNRHQSAEISRSVQEGIAFSLVYGIELLDKVGITPQRLKAGLANMYLSPVFSQSIVNAAQIAVDLMESDGAMGAALGAGIGIGYFNSPKEAVAKLKIKRTIEPDVKYADETAEAYANWKNFLPA
ncbi:xylulokinase [Aquirufa ecclesiirivi]|uniref:xylulokinase n=1 Tax=Aquirufa ecclesiirivi TaxID=2715124 RepID=UPI0023D7BBBB|nr:FGGY family carbohydrate kinase [Aquirufa ecclesiirivi]MDF0693808.1 FGGY family carbohydrate kinase [Aquirufa ecclesiirivi]